MIPFQDAEHVKRAAYAREWGRTHKNQINTYRRHRWANDLVWRGKGLARRKRRELVAGAYIDSLKTGGCVDCGNKNLSVLEFDHLRDKRREVSNMDGFAWAEIDAEVAKCEVVCANCHQIRTNARRAQAVA